MPQLEQGEVDLDQLTFKISSSCQIWPLQTQIYYKNAFKTHWLLEKSTNSDPFPVLFPSKYIISDGKQAKEWATKTIKSLLWIPMTSHKSFWSNTFRIKISTELFKCLELLAWQMSLVGCQYPYKMEQSWEWIFLKLGP